MSYIKRGVQIITLVAGALLLSSCYAVVEDRGWRPHFKHHQHDYRAHHHRPYGYYYRYRHDDHGRAHRRGRHRHRH
jgi:hypothetical protein